MLATEKFNQLSAYMDYYIERKAVQYGYAYYIIGTDVMPDFPKNYEWVKHDKNMELIPIQQIGKRKNGWNEPDKIICNSIEVRYLMQEFEPLPFELWKNIKFQYKNFF